jgi:hypothetical protein
MKNIEQEGYNIMKILQSNVIYNSLEEFREQSVDKTNRVCIDNDDIVVTFLPDYVFSFPGSMQELIKKGASFGSYPSSFFFNNRKECEKRDAARETVTSAINDTLKSIIESSEDDLYDYLSLNLASIINDPKAPASIKLNPLHETKIAMGQNPEIPLFDHYANMIRSSILTTYMFDGSSSFIKRLPKEVELWLNNQFDHDFQDNIRFTPTRYNQISMILLWRVNIDGQVDQEINNLVQSILVKGYQTLISRAKQQKTIGSDEQSVNWLPTFFNELSRGQLEILIKAFLVSKNPIKEVESLIEFLEHVEMQHPNSELFQKSSDLIGILPVLRVLADNLPEYDPFLEHYLNHDEIEDVQESEDQWEMLEGYVFLNPNLSWKAKAICTYLVCYGYEGTVKLAELVSRSKEGRAAVYNAINEIENEELAFFDEDDKVLFIIEDFEECRDNPEKTRKFRKVMMDRTLSWKAKGIHLFMSCFDETSEQILLESAIDGKQSLINGLNELLNAGIINKPLDKEEKPIDVKEMEKRKSDEQIYWNQIRPLFFEVTGRDDCSSDIFNVTFGENRQTLLQKAACHGDTELVGRLLMHPLLDIDYVDKEERTALLIACSEKQSTIAEMLILHNSDINHQGFLGQNPFFFAVINKLDVVDCFLNHGVDVNRISIGGTALHAAVHTGELQLVQKLVKFGANPSLKDLEGKTPLDIAYDEGLNIIISFLSKVSKPKSYCPILIRS